jgi:hypothetical protein
MTDPDDSLRTYVRATLALQGYAFSGERVAEITVQFARIAAIAATLPPADRSGSHAADPGTAPVFRP